MKKRILALLLVVTFLFALSASAFAASSFDKSYFVNSRKYTQNGTDWNIQGGYSKHYTNADTSVRVLLFKDYVTKGWGPQLRVSYYNGDLRSYVNITGFYAFVDDKIYAFSDMGQSSMNGAGYVFGGEVMQKFLSALPNAREVSFLYEYENNGQTGQGWDGHIHTGELSNLADMGKYMNGSRAWTIDQDPKGSDKAYGAYVLDNK